MARSAATTVEQYLAELPPERRAIMAAMRSLVLEHLPAGYQESMNWGMITYEVPLARYAGAPSRQPLMYLGLAARKRGYTLHAMTAAGEQEPWLRAEFARAGKRLDMGRACIHFDNPDDLPLPVIAELVARTPVSELIAWYESARNSRA